MILETHLLAAIRENGISKVAIVDDAFDAPTVTEENAGDLLDFLQNGLVDEFVAELEIDEATIDVARTALGDNDFESPELIDVVRALYLRYVDTLDEAYNPRQIFADQRENIENVTPILTMLNRCDPELQIARFGSDEGSAALFDEDTHLIFVDYFLEAGVSETATTTKQRRAKELASQRVGDLIRKQKGKAASVVLMSSADKRGDAEAFRAGIGLDDQSLVFASRFGFVRKTDFKTADGDVVCISNEAGDELLDVLQSYEFARGTHAALELWFRSAQEASKSVWDEIAKLGLKDFAYLHRFRLSQEGQEILSYLEWFFGQCLLDELGRRIDENAKGDARLEALKSGEAQRRVEGTFDGPTEAIAALYHKARIESPRGEHARFRLGDLFVKGTGANRSIHAVLNPDCDLVERGAKPKRLSKRSITVSGTLKKLDAPDSSVAEFIRLANVPYNISWQKKNIETIEFDHLGKSPYSFVGTLRPLYAQDLQRTILTDLGRVGLSVAPAMGVSARATVFLRTDNGNPKEMPLGNPKAADCYVIPGRGGDDKPIQAEARAKTRGSRGVREGPPSRCADLTQPTSASDPDTSAPDPASRRSRIIADEKSDTEKFMRRHTI
ncbi:MAG: hypothetical protein CFE29_01810 [Bradyrhizobiaceae bacterium PARB1]|jgi:hypothetical protein|nr:MAG: hypothetical protein CFE29_01810 [Bradyrhizobiaceae bacterium PARB1]